MIELAAILVAFGIGFVIGRIGARELIAMLRRRDDDDYIDERGNPDAP